MSKDKFQEVAKEIMAAYVNDGILRKNTTIRIVLALREAAEESVRATRQKDVEFVKGYTKPLIITHQNMLNMDDIVKIRKVQREEIAVALEKAG